MTERVFDDFVYQVWEPGLSPKYLEAMINAGVKALIIEGYHSGTLPAGPEAGDYDLVPLLEYARQKQVPVFLTFRPHVGDPDNSIGYKPFDEGREGYETSTRLLEAGVVPLKANWQQIEEVCQKMRGVLGITDDYQSIIDLIYEAFPFKVPLERIQSTGG